MRTKIGTLILSVVIALLYGGCSSGGVGVVTDAASESEPLRPQVDRAAPQLYEIRFRPDEADPRAKHRLGMQLAFLDTRVEPVGKLVVHLHGAGIPEVCGRPTHGRLVASFGFHVFSPCYDSGYGVGNCGDDIGGCRLEAFEGVDHHALLQIGPPDCTETRIVKALEFLAKQNPQGGWGFFIEDGKPRWGSIIVSGISHGASSSGVIAMHRQVDRVVMLSGPLDTDQAWLKGTPITALERFYALTHTGDTQHPGHLAAFGDLALPGDPFIVDGASPPFGGAHRLVTSVPSPNGHSAVRAGDTSPKDESGNYVLEPVWRYMYGVTE